MGGWPKQRAEPKCRYCKKTKAHHGDETHEFKLRAEKAYKASNSFSDEEIEAGREVFRFAMLGQAVPSSRLKQQPLITLMRKFNMMAETIKTSVQSNTDRGEQK